MTDPTIFTVGGTVQAGGGIYLPRPADDELLQHCQAGDFSYVLTARQLGKSSLMVRTAGRLNAAGTRTAIIDLTRLGASLEAEQWYLGLVDELVEQLDLDVDCQEWWRAHAHLGNTHRLSRFLREVALEAEDTPLVVFIDEIDTTLNLPFSDDFFAAIRACYNARGTDPAYKRLAFVLLGVATPGDLIRDPQRTPFNIGARIDLSDFTLEQALPLADGLALPQEQARQVLAWALDWTGGHPYLTQRLCRELVERGRAEWDQEAVTQAVEETFFGEKSKQDNNLGFVHDMLTRRAPDVRKVLLTYQKVCNGIPVKNEEQSLVVAHLKISGVVQEKGGWLVVRNRIYESVFDPVWVGHSIPSPIPQRILWSTSILVLLALIVAGYFGYQEWNRTDSERAALFEQAFETAKQDNNVQAELENLAGLFNLQGDYTVRAISLFNGLQQEQKLQLFEPVNSDNARNDQVIVAMGVYQAIGYKNTPDEEGDVLLAKISETVRESAPELAEEIKAWVQGRIHLNEGYYAEAKNDLEEAIHKNPNNPALYYDCARAHIGMKYYSNALDDLNKVVHLAPNHTSVVRILIDKDIDFSQYWNENRNSFSILATAMPLVTEIIDASGIPMSFIPAGEFIMGSENGYTDEMPVHAVYLDSYYIDRYEVTNTAYKLCVVAGMCLPPHDIGSYTRANYFDDPQFDNYPVINVDWDMAKSYCQWRDARLPTEAEWEKAARGTDGRTYPWGENIGCTHANISNCFGDAIIVGSYESGQSPYGVYDMTGNVWEWTADWYDETYYADSPASNPAGPESGVYKVLRGGSWVVTVSSLNVSVRLGYVPANWNFTLGFRCARSFP